MPATTSNRRSAAFVCLLVVLAGCAASPDRPLPERPENLTTATVSDYVAASERIRVLNAVSVTPTDTSLSCDGAVAAQSSDGYVAFADCTGGISLPDGSHADEHAHAAYLVSNRTTTRISSRDTDGVAAPDADAENASGIQVYNFDDGAHALTVTVRRPDTGETVTRTRYELNGTTGAVVYGIPYEDETTVYVVTVALGGEASATFEWRPEAEDGLHVYRRIVAVTPSEEIVSGRLSE